MMINARFRSCASSEGAIHRLIQIEPRRGGMFVAKRQRYSYSLIEAACQILNQFRKDSQYAHAAPMGFSRKLTPWCYKHVAYCFNTLIVSSSLMQPTNILFVDDDKVIRTVFCKIVKHLMTCHVQTAVDGIDALKQLKTFKAHIVITDLMMPKMDGITLLKKIKDLYPKYL